MCVTVIIRASELVEIASASLSRVKGMGPVRRGARPLPLANRTRRDGHAERAKPPPVGRDEDLTSEAFVVESC